jgi:exodeoxyribonuclease (lambda-induced)
MLTHNKFEQGSDEWRQIRAGKITGTLVKKLMGSDWLKLADQIISELITGERIESDYESDAMIRGKELEPIARSEYSRLTGYEVYTAGFLQPDRFKYFGLSPDGIIISQGRPVGGLEIKCPQPNTHIGYIRQGKIPTEYLPQLLGWFILDENINYVDFVSYCPEITYLPMFIRRITRAEAFDKIQELSGKLVKFETYVDEFMARLQSNSVVVSDIVQRVNAPAVNTDSGSLDDDIF